MTLKFQNNNDSYGKSLFQTNNIKVKELKGYFFKKKNIKGLN